MFVHRISSVQRSVFTRYYSISKSAPLRCIRTKFSTTCRMAAGRNSPGAVKQLKSYKPDFSPSVGSSTGSLLPATHKLALKSSPTLLYQARSTVLYMVGCHAISGVCFFIGGLNLWNVYIDKPEHLNTLLSNAVAGCCVAIFFLGIYNLLKVSDRDGSLYPVLMEHNRQTALFRL